MFMSSYSPSGVANLHAVLENGDMNIIRVSVVAMAKRVDNDLARGIGRDSRRIDSIDSYSPPFFDHIDSFLLT